MSRSLTRHRFREATVVTEVPLEGIEEKLQTILHGGIRGRVVVKHDQPEG